MRHHLQRGSLPVSNAKGISKPTESEDLDQMMPLLSEDNPEMLKPSEDATQSRMQMKQSWSCIPMSILRKVCWIICLIIEAAALLFLLVIFCAAI
ncbi:uncharacterized protein LOC131179884 isoform X5 [Hevea brasiliensis]|uniref:uncharacterized protein LOC131179884 isoform X5 n=1 Tax=Hevea brasiliensis TaxID=3981 RepID=UPI0025DA6823|nr:uncharacterized protein LOC131179884 isoform X5 [Hevea brasiliensis]XP_058002731.1 uncharacterized protein LOC131179884 isoform X5 [Hevea brasiliensis]